MTAVSRHLRTMTNGQSKMKCKQKKRRHCHKSQTMSAPESSLARIGSWNIFSGTRVESLAEYAKLCIEMGIPILAVQETKRKSSAVEDWYFEGELKDWRFVGTGNSKKVGGVGFLLGPDVELIEYVEHAENVWGRIFSIRVILRGLRLKITNVYAPHEGYATSTKQTFYSRMKKCLAEMDKFQTGQEILLGDFNAEVGFSDTEDYDEVCGNNIRRSRYTSDNGSYLLELLNQRKLQLLNTHFMSNIRHEGTHFGVKSRKWRRIDYIATSRKFRTKLAKGCRAHTGLSLQAGKSVRGKGGYTDHNPLVLELFVPGKKRLKKLMKKKKTEKTRRYDVSALQNDVVRTNFIASLGRMLKGGGVTLNEVNDNVMSAYIDAMAETLPVLGFANTIVPEWDDDEVIALQKELKITKKFKDRKIIANKLTHARARAKREFFERQANEINEHDVRREIDKLYKKSKLYGKNTKAADPSDYISEKDFGVHFEKQFKSEARFDEGELPPEIQHYGQGEYTYLQDIKMEIDESAPTSDEIRGLLKSMKNGRSAGLDGIPMECMKYGENDDIIDEITKLQELVWEYEDVPERWLDSETNVLYKKGNRKITSNYRGLSITDNLSRITPMIIIQRLKAVYEANLDPFQFGFRIDRSTVDNLFIYSQLRKSTDKTLFALYIDLTAAFDKIPRRYLWEVIRRRTGANKLVNILQALYTNNRGNIKNSEIWYKIFGGTRQGGIESPPSFVWYFDFVLKIIRHRINKEIGKTGAVFDFRIDHSLKAKRGDDDRNSKMSGSVTVPALLFADDDTELEEDPEKLKKVLQIMDEECSRFGLYVSFKKTFTQEWPVGTSKPETEPDKPLFEITDSNGNNHQIMNKTAFKALGVTLDNTDPGGYISHRIAQATGQFEKYRKVLTDWKIKKWVRKKFLESYVRSTLLYGITLNVQQRRKSDCLPHHGTILCAR